jgi:GTP 3',8-cyclase
MFDTYGRQIDYLRVSVTDRCNLRCSYCMTCGHFHPVRNKPILSFEEILAVVRAGADLGINKIRLTGGEPLVRTDVVDLVRAIATVPGIRTVAMTTNGVLLPRYAGDLREAGLHVVNISLDTLDPVRYASITGNGRLQWVIDGILAARDAGFERIKINTVVAPETTDLEIEAIRAFCHEYGLLHQRIALYDLETEKHDNHNLERPLPCAECNRIRLLSTGLLKPCLHSNEEVPLNAQDPAESLRRAIELKPEHGSVCTNRSMMEIGG